MSPGGTLTLRAARTWASRPMAPPATSSRARMVWGWWRYIRPSTQWWPAASAASKQRAASSALVANGFSQSTCLPASSALTVHSVCIDTGRGR
jgi:hypothetical protein